MNSTPVLRAPKCAHHFCSERGRPLSGRSELILWRRGREGRKVAARSRRRRGRRIGRTDGQRRRGEAISAAQVTKPDPGARMRVRAGGGRAPKKCPRIIESSGTRSVRISFVNRNQFFSAGRRIRRRSPSENGAGLINFRLPRLFAERPTHSRNRNSRNRSTIDPKLDAP